MSNTAHKARLRKQFERRDRDAARLALSEAKLREAIRALADAEGVVFMREEAARRVVFELGEVA